MLPDTAPHDTVTTEPDATLPGSAGEHLLQCAYGSQDRAARFYADQMRDRLLPKMVEFIGRMEMVFVASADSGGECDASLRAGPPGFIQVLDERHLAYPEYRGNGVHASLGNITENPHVGLLMIDFERDLIGLHVNGAARVETDRQLRARHPELPLDAAPGRRAERWVVIEVHEAYIHCRKHIPRMTRAQEKREWGTDDPARKGGDYFGAKEAPAIPKPAEAAAARSGSSEEPTGPIQVPRQRGRSGFPSTTHLPAGAATARPLRPLSVGPRDRRRPRWLTS